MLNRRAVIIDAVFGNGGRGDLPKSVSHLLRTVNRLSNFKIALDCPSGMDSSGRQPHEDALKADLTICVGFYKDYFLKNKNTELLGQIELVGEYFKVPSSIQNQTTKIYGIDPQDFCFTSWPRTSYKSEYGHCGLVAGSSKTPGAAFLAAEAAHRVGAGYVSVFFAEPRHLNISVKDASFILKQKWNLTDLKAPTAMILGCGGFSSRIKSLSQPHVIDAEALIPMSKVKAKSSGPRIFTPHPGEAARLLQTSTKVIQRDRFAALSQLVKMTDAAVYLKGAPGILKFRDDPNSYYVNLSMNPIFAKAGSGDLLAGMIGGFLAQAPKRQISFESAVLSSLAFQREVGEILRTQRATIASDQLSVFSEAFRRLSRRARGA